MIAIVFVYWLLAAPVYGTIRASAQSLRGEATVAIRLGGVELMHVTRIAVGENGWPLSALPLLGAPKKEAPEPSAGLARLRKRLEAAVRREAHIEQLRVTVRVGLGEAWSTALAAGSARAAVFSALSFLPMAGDADVRVIPDFASACFCAQLQCIFSVTPGDIILKTAFGAIKRAKKLAIS